jgi:DNA polymerase IV
LSQAEWAIRRHTGNGPAFVEALPVGKFHGIGPATSASMNSLGLRTGLDMRNQSLEFMQATFGKAGAYYYWISRGVDNRDIRADRIRKSVEAENTFSSDLTEFEAMLSELQPADQQGLATLRGQGHAGPDRQSQGEFMDFELITRSRTLPSFVDARTVLEFVTVDLLRMVLPIEKAVRLTGHI